MVDPGDTVSRTLKKEFGEEAMNSMEASETEKIEIERHINELFKGGTKVGRNPRGGIKEGILGKVALGEGPRKRTKMEDQGGG